MAAPEGLIAAIDQVIAFFNAKRMDLPDGFFDRKTQFVLNGARVRDAARTSRRPTR